MKNPCKIIATGIMGLISLTACDLEGASSVKQVENSLTQFALINEVAQNANESSLKFNFNGYKLTKSNSGYNVELFGKLVDANNYNSFMTASYTDVPSKEFRKINEGERLLLKAFANITTGNYNPTIQNVEVENFEGVDSAVTGIVPKTDKYGHELDSASAHTIYDLKYDATNKQISFDSVIKAHYIWKATSYIYTDAGMIPYDVDYHNDEVLTYNVKYDMSNEEYFSHKDDSVYLINKFENMVETNDSHYSATQIEDENLENISIIKNNNNLDM